MEADATELELQALRDRLVDQLRDVGHITRPLVEAAFRAVPRHLFLPAQPAADVYSDQAFVTKRDSDGRPSSSSSQPSIMATMLEQLGAEPGHRVLEIGAGTGYNAALLAHMVGPDGAVVTIDLDEEVVEEARAHLAAAGCSAVAVGCGDGMDGSPSGAPYDRIIVTVGAWDLAPAWLEQLAGDGRLVVPLSLRGAQRSIAFERREGHLASVSVSDCGFMRMRGAGAGSETTIQLGDEGGLFVEVDGQRPVDTAAVYEALSQPGETMAGGVVATRAEVSALGLWLAIHEPDLARLFALGPAVGRGLVPPLITFAGQAQAVTMAVLGERALAALVWDHDPTARSDPARVTARAHGPGAVALARRLLAHLHAWDKHGRPSTADLRISAYPHGAQLEPDAVAIPKRHTVIAVAWSNDRP